MSKNFPYDEELMDAIKTSPNYPLKFKGYTPVKTGDKVEIHVGDEDDTWYPTKVKYCLAAQFTVKHNKRELFYFYADKDVTWRKISE